MLDVSSKHMAVERAERRRSLMNPFSQHADSGKSALPCSLELEVEQWYAASLEHALLEYLRDVASLRIQNSRPLD